jgi:DNA-binding NarL/FixJ family response regulator
MNSCTERVLIVANSRIAATAIKSTLQRASCSQVIGYVGIGRPCGVIVADLLPDVVVVLEADEPEDVLARVRDVRDATVATKVIVVTDSMDSDWLARLNEAGADAAVRKVPDVLTLGALVREVIRGNLVGLRAPAAAQPAGSKQLDTAGLTTREREILMLVAEGWQNGEIAARLWITEQTVKFHLSNVYRKLGVANRTQASHVAYVGGIIGAPPVSGGRLGSAA